MEWLRLVAASLLSALLAGIAIHLKNSKEMDVKLAVLENRISNNEQDIGELKETTAESISDIATDMKSAARELLTAASNVQAMAQTQNVVNSVSTKLLDGLSLKVEVQGEAISELRGIVHGLGVIKSQNNHKS